MHRNKRRARVAMILLNHLVGEAEQWQRTRQAKCRGGLEIDDQLDLRGPLNRQIGRLLAVENSPGVDADRSVIFRFTASVARQAAGRGELAKLGDRGYPLAERQSGKLFDPAC
jgi:hypothetical protein